jgi:streptomycin 6-kinase
MAKVKKDLTWMDVDPAAVKGNKAYDAYKAAQKTARELQHVFEVAFIKAAREKKAIADNETLRFSYRFGKLSVAKDAKDDDKKASGGTFKL